jgi:integrin beta 3
MRIDVEKFIAGIHEYLGLAFEPIIKRLAKLEARQPEKGEPGQDGKDGKDGVDGKSVTLEDVIPVLKAMQGEWALDFERRAQALFQKAVDAIPKPVDGKDGQDGKDGVDGLGWDNLVVEFDGKRTFGVKLIRADVEKVAGDIKMPVVLDAGFWKEGSYEKGDGVTFGGSYWIAQKDTNTKPEVGNPDWRLAVKKGRDGKRD